MPTFSVVAETDAVVWQGEAETAADACTAATQAARVATGVFRAYDAEPPSHRDHNSTQLVLTVYLGEAEWPFDENQLAGTFVADAPH